jgi:hypothetical protein
MENRNYSAEIEITQLPQEVFTCITHVTKWWSDDYKGSATKLNDEFVIHHPGQHYSKQKLIEVNPGKKVVWLVTESNLNWIKKNKEEWTNTKVIFEIVTKNNKTVLHFTHDGLTPEKECYAMCAQGWNVVIKEWLFCFIATGMSARGMLNAGKLRNQHWADKAKRGNENFHRVITVHASAKEVMKKISQINCWWVKNISGKTEKLNDQFHVPMGKTFIDFQITELDPDKRVVWKVTNSYIYWLQDKHEWTNTEVVFEVSEKGNTAQVDFTHIGLVPGIECYQVCDEGWNGHITQSLMSFINKGKGMPKEF